jgi:prevent-host-death family protein
MDLMKTVGIFEGKTHFSALIEEAAGGATIVVTNKGRPVAKIVPFEVRGTRREFGFDNGRLHIADDFDEIPAELLAAFDVD